MDRDDLPKGIGAVFTERGVSGPIRWLHEGDEWVFVVSTKGAAAMREAELTAVLQRLLNAKVWIATDGPAWVGRGTAL